MDNDPDAPKLEDLADDELLALAFERGISVRGARSVCCSASWLPSIGSSQDGEVSNEANQAKYRVYGVLESL